MVAIAMLALSASAWAQEISTGALPNVADTQRWQRRMDFILQSEALARDDKLVAALQKDALKFPLPEAAEQMEARQTLARISRLSESPTLAETLRGYGIEPDVLGRTARDPSVDALAKLVDIKKLLGTDALGRVVVSEVGVRVVKPLPLADDRDKPGETTFAASNNPSAKLVWRSGLTYAGLLAKASPSPTMVCSGTVVERYWFVTAAHCLREASSSNPLSAQDMLVFLPFQGGAETVKSARGPDNQRMRRVNVIGFSWLGGATGALPPKTPDGISIMAREGRDLALLELDHGQVHRLPSAIPPVKLAFRPVYSPVSLVGYGLTDVQVSDLTLLVGLRDALPTGALEGSDSLLYGEDVQGTQSGTCGGDSGGGVFQGLMDGTQEQVSLMGVISSLVSKDAGSADVCIAASQVHASLLSERNRGYLCNAVPGVCRD